ncbi:hypothetical protein N0V86_002409 [Didymella sp. IMI 355093]|nr:hypothetical protein N0V86_002409 [Didymella sp. IMI 355093]
MPSNHSDTRKAREPQSGHRLQTWVDLYNLANGAPRPTPSPRLVARIDKIKESLESIEWKIEIRRQVLNLVKNQGVYCTVCSHLRVATSFTYCSVTCPLLRGFERQYFTGNPGEIQLAKKDLERYDKLVIDISYFGNHADRRTVTKWEAVSKHLLTRTEDSKPQYPNQLAIMPVRGLNQRWKFTDRWGRGPGLEAELAPDEGTIASL